MQLLRGLEQNGVNVSGIETRADKVAIAIKSFERTRAETMTQIDEQ